MSTSSRGRLATGGLDQLDELVERLRARGAVDCLAGRRTSGHGGPAGRVQRECQEASDLGLARGYGVAAVLPAAAALVLLAVTLGRDRALVSRYRSGTVAPLVPGVAVCPVTWIGLRAAWRWRPS